MISTIRQESWDGWSKEYLNTLKTKYKWKKQNSNIQTEEVVLLKDESIGAQKWNLGKVINTIKGSDDKFRVVEVKINSAIKMRSRISPLPINDEKENQTHQINRKNSSMKNIFFNTMCFVYTL